MKHKTSKLLSILLALALVMGIAPAMSVPAQAAENDGVKAISLGTAALEGPTPNVGPNEGQKYYTPNSYVYYGYWSAPGDLTDPGPIKWRVLDAEKANDGKTAGAFLLSEYLLGKGDYVNVFGDVYFQEIIHRHDDYGNDYGEWYRGGDDDDTDHGECVLANVYQGSDAQKWCSTFASNPSNFSDLEQAAMLGVAKTDSAEGSFYYIRWGESGLTTADKVFFLSAEELADYVGNYTKAPGLTASYNDGGRAGVWWFRSPSDDYAGAVDLDGDASYGNVRNSWAARPAFNLNLDSVLFTSAAEGGKIPAAAGGNGGEAAGEIFEIQPYTGNEWKLTLKDENRKFEVTENAASGVPGGTIKLNYTGATVYDETNAPNEYISAILTDENGNLLRYGRLTQPSATDDKVDFIVPEDLEEGTYILKLFSEQYNGDYKTDYASAFDDVTLTVKTKDDEHSGSERYTLTYETNGGSKIAATKHVKNATVNLTVTPTRAGYDFTGWYAEADLTNKITSIRMDNHKTVYAGWKEKGENPEKPEEPVVEPEKPGIVTPDALDGDNHFAYVAGYPDGAFRPDRPVTRAETASMIYRLLKAERRAQIYTTTNHFSDVKATSWYNEAVSSMANGGYVAGYPDGTFGGGKNITRAEFVTMLVNFMGISEGTAVFSDVKESHWAYKQIATASKGLVSGYPDGTFRPDQPITRAEAVSILNRILNRGVNETSRLGDFKNFTDNTNLSAWYYFEVIEAANGHEYEGRRPNENWISIITN